MPWATKSALSSNALTKPWISLSTGGGNARLAYKTMGTLSGAKDNAVLLPHMYTGTAAFMQAYVGPGRPLDPDRYFFILPAQFGDGFSSSPSNTPPPFDRGAFPPV